MHLWGHGSVDSHAWPTYLLHVLNQIFGMTGTHVESALLILPHLLQVPAEREWTRGHGGGVNVRADWVQVFQTKLPLCPAVVTNCAHRVVLLCVLVSFLLLKPRGSLSVWRSGYTCDCYRGWICNPCLSQLFLRNTVKLRQLPMNIPNTSTQDKPIAFQGRNISASW